MPQPHRVRLSRPQRIALERANRKYGCDLTTIHTNTADLLTASGLTTITDPSDTGTWRLIITPAGQQAIRDNDDPPIIEITRKDSVHLLRRHGRICRMPHPDPQPGQPRSIPEPEEILDTEFHRELVVLAKARHRETNTRQIRSIARRMHTEVNAAGDLDLSAPLAEIARQLDHIRELRAAATEQFGPIDEHHAA